MKFPELRYLNYYQLTFMGNQPQGVKVRHNYHTVRNYHTVHVQCDSYVVHVDLADL